MLETRATRRVAGQNTAKSDMSNLETRLLKKRKASLRKIISNILEPQPLTLSLPKSLHPSSPKRMRTSMSDEVCRADWEISALTCETGEVTKPDHPMNFKFWNKNFNGLKFLYNHLNATEDMNKVKTTWRQKLTQNSSSYLMRLFVLTRGLFEVVDDHAQNEIKLNEEVNQLKEQQKMQAVKLSNLEKQLSEEKTKREKIRGYESGTEVHF